MIRWKKADISSIKVALSGSISKSKGQIAEKIARHRGVDKRSAREKIDEILEKERIKKICRYADKKKQKLKEKFRRKKSRLKSKAKRRLKGGV